MDKIKQTKLHARLGERVAFWLNGPPNFDLEPCVADVIGVGLNGRMNLFVIYTGPLKGGGRPFAHILGAVPFDVDATATQLDDTGTWMPMEMYHEKNGQRIAEKEAEAKEAAEKERLAKEAERAKKEAANKPKTTPAADPHADPAIESSPSDSQQKSGGKKIQPVNA